MIYKCGFLPPLGYGSFGDAYGLPPIMDMPPMGIGNIGSSSLLTPSVDCIDRSADCPLWASTGQCLTAGGHIARLCPQSCGTCFGNGRSYNFGYGLNGIGRFGYGLGYNYNNDYLGLGLNSYGLGSGLSDGSIFGSSFYPGLDGFRLPYLSYPLKYKQSKSTRLDDQKKPKSPFD
ncbi:unnamed protein product [Enterobius vermicularis]|uniref:ShKT domain-containing protein n=1 Tax=Enterobius vermicularis TaxID=51028 RepID=A0A0N4VNH5_ENTVE|nr:unnamed protein product [Enterobius vermicularis]